MAQSIYSPGIGMAQSMYCPVTGMAQSVLPKHVHPILHLTDIHSSNFPFDWFYVIPLRHVSNLLFTITSFYPLSSSDHVALHMGGGVTLRVGGSGVADRHHRAPTTTGAV